MSRLLVAAVMLLVVLGGIYGYARSGGSGGAVETTPAVGVPGSGLVYVKDMPGLKVVVTLPRRTVRLGETLRIGVKLVGEKAYGTGILRLTVLNRHGEKVFDAYIWLPHITLTSGQEPPREERYTLTWTATTSETGEAHVTPGTYTLILTTKDGQEIVKTTITVQP